MPFVLPKRSVRFWLVHRGLVRREMGSTPICAPVSKTMRESYDSAFDIYQLEGLKHGELGRD